MEKKKRNKKLVNSIITIAVVSTIIVAIILAVVGTVLIDDAYEEMTEEELAATAHMLQDLYNFAVDGDWSYDTSTGTLYKGETKMSDNYELMDDIHSKAGIDLTLFYMDTRILCTMKNTSGQRRCHAGGRQDPPHDPEEYGGRLSS